jgi:hypothetical protein
MATPEEHAALPQALVFRPRPIGDPIDMELILQVADAEKRNQLIAARLETVAAVYHNIAEGAAKTAAILTGAGDE